MIQVTTIEYHPFLPGAVVCGYAQGHDALELGSFHLLPRTQPQAGLESIGILVDSRILVLFEGLRGYDILSIHLSSHLDIFSYGLSRYLVAIR